jgi:hypothetical protein
MHLMTKDGTTESARKVRRRTPLQVQARRMSKLLSIEFGLAVRAARLCAGLTRTDVATLARVTQTYISRVDLGDQNVTWPAWLVWPGRTAWMSGSRSPARPYSPATP